MSNEQKARTIPVGTIVRAIHQLRSVAEAPQGAYVADYRIPSLMVAHALENCISGMGMVIEPQPQTEPQQPMPAEAA